MPPYDPVDGFHDTGGAPLVQVVVIRLEECRHNSVAIFEVAGNLLADGYVLLFVHGVPRIDQALSLLSQEDLRLLVVLPRDETIAGRVGEEQSHLEIVLVCRFAREKFAAPVKNRQLKRWLF